VIEGKKVKVERQVLSDIPFFDSILSGNEDINAKIELLTSPFTLASFEDLCLCLKEKSLKPSKFNIKNKKNILRLVALWRLADFLDIDWIKRDISTSCSKTIGSIEKYFHLYFINSFFKLKFDGVLLSLRNNYRVWSLCSN